MSSTILKECNAQSVLFYLIIIHNWTWTSYHRSCVCFSEIVKGDYYQYVVFCTSPTGGSLQGASERMSEETNVGGLLSSGSGEVWIYSISVGLGLAEEKQWEWVDSALRSSGGGQRKRQRKEKCRKNGAQSKVQHHVQQLLCEILKCCLLALACSVLSEKLALICTQC